MRYIFMFCFAMLSLNIHMTMKAELNHSVLESLKRDLEDSSSKNIPVSLRLKLKENAEYRRKIKSDLIPQLENGKSVFIYFMGSILGLLGLVCSNEQITSFCLSGVCVYKMYEASNMRSAVREKIKILNTIELQD